MILLLREDLILQILPLLIVLQVLFRQLRLTTLHSITQNLQMHQFLSVPLVVEGEGDVILIKVPMVAAMEIRINKFVKNNQTSFSYPNWKKVAIKKPFAEFNEFRSRMNNKVFF